MYVVFSAQYNKPCIVATTEDSADAIIAACREEGAIYYKDGPDDECFVVELREHVGPELFTHCSLDRTCGG